MALTEMQTLILWALLAKPGGAGLQKDIRPDVKKADREALVGEGLIRSDPKSRPIMLEVTDKGWAWAADHLDAELPKRSVHGAAILQAWLKRLKAFMAAKDFGLADVLAPPATTEPARDDYSALRGRIRQSYLEATGGRLNQRVFLNVLRDELGDVDRSALDHALRKMHLEEGSHLSGSDNPPEITDAIRDASLDFKGERMFVLWITR
ncbi:MAG TPA: hypothetical protein VGL41_03610 [Roseiarcus sp.]